MLNQKDISERMSKDIDEMEKMLNDYLQFAKTQLQEETSKINLLLLFKEIKEEVNNKNLIIDVKNEITLNGRHQALKRCFLNLIQNALIYGKHVYIKIQTKTQSNIFNRG